MHAHIPEKQPLVSSQQTPYGPDLPTLPPVDDTTPSTVKYRPFRDIWLGAFYGASAVDVLGSLGVITWIVTGFVPVLGTIVALRDARYAFRVRDWWSLVFNLIGLVPFLEGFSAFAILARFRRYQHVMHSAHRVAHAMKHGRRLGTVGRRAATSTFITGAAHGASTLSTVHYDHPAPRQDNRAAWPAFLLGLLLLFLLPAVVIMAIAADINSTGLLQLLSLPKLLGLVGVLVCASFALLLFAQHARQVSKRLNGEGQPHGVVSWLAVFCTRIAFVVTLVSTALIIYGERTSIFPQ